MWMVVAGVPGDDLSWACLDSVHAGADAEGVLEVLLGAGLRNARDFAVCEVLERGTCRILVRGSAQADVGVGGQIEAVSGRGVFADREIADVDWVVIRLGGESTEPIVPLSMGLVPTALIRLELDSGRRAPAVPDGTPSGRPVPDDSGEQVVITDAISSMAVTYSPDVQETAATALDQGISVYPPLCTTASRPVGDASRRPVPWTELTGLLDELATAPEGPVRFQIRP